MMSLLEFKSKIQNLYLKYSIYIDLIIKFIIALIVFQLINSNIGYDERLKSFPIVLVLSLLSAFTPSAVLVLFAIILSLLQVFHVSPILSFILLVILLIMYFLYLHFTPELGFVILAIPILHILNIPFIIPIILGLFFTPISIIASACGIILSFLFDIIIEVVNMQFGNTIEDAIEIFTYVINGLISNQGMIMTIIIFSLVILFTYITKRLKLDYAHEIAVGIGAITGILGFLFADLRLGVTEQIGPMIIGNLVSAVLALVIQFFYRALDYSRSEHIQFEDDEYYYYVKAIPKIVVAEEKFNVKRINPQRRNKKKMPKDDLDKNNEYDDLYSDDLYEDDNLEDSYDYYDDVDGETVDGETEDGLFFEDYDD